MGIPLSIMFFLPMSAVTLPVFYIANNNDFVKDKFQYIFLFSIIQTHLQYKKMRAAGNPWSTGPTGDKTTKYSIGASFYLALSLWSFIFSVLFFRKQMIKN